ncbi:UDP-N-acetylenolpyruvoylglucosamine reductase [Desulfosarcina alkanivorans]|uniref:UDP-N-acetylenolpyruvoylglucosamine reductase n=1 Tax=Desulfosarcina alkanivorans TaxID=571177 RepID=A0A5K7YS52_9BACT|nr:UDP-N-acetylmuramate dehydrogenase [Desulfosarcina alkanivorans]BBO71003.1 UDP-N-acetylenolpyruvoylglucosamine reductase [Desulfosarcina alkanivorans]
MECKTDFSLKALNTFNVQANAARYVRFDEPREIVDFMGRNPLGGRRCLVLGGGSNLLFVDDYDGTVLHPMLKGVEVVETGRRHIRLRAMAGENWDDLVALTVANGWGGIENLSLIPGSVGASAVQNIGAYGVEVKDVIDRVEAISMDSLENVTFAPADCGFGYRTSHFKDAWTGRFIITAVTFTLGRQPELVLDYPGLRTAVDELGSRALGTLRQAVIAIRQRKLPDPAVTGNAGSFFKNPVVDRRTLAGLQRVYPDVPHYPQGGDRFKLAAGWLIERCGWKGKQVGRAAVHDRQALVLVNLGGATGREIFELSEQVRGSVHARCGIELEREVLLVP